MTSPILFLHMSCVALAVPFVSIAASTPASTPFEIMSLGFRALPGNTLGPRSTPWSIAKITDRESLAKTLSRRSCFPTREVGGRTLNLVSFKALGELVGLSFDISTSISSTAWEKIRDTHSRLARSKFHRIYLLRGREEW